MNNDQVPKEQVRNSIFFDNFHACFSTTINYFHDQICMLLNAKF